MGRARAWTSQVLAYLGCMLGKWVWVRCVGVEVTVKLVWLVRA